MCLAKHLNLKKISYIFGVLLAFMYFTSRTNFAFAQYGVDTSFESQLTEDEKKDAIEIKNINERPIKVEAGESVVYKVAGQDIYLKVFSTSEDTSVPDAPITLTQTCGIDVSSGGIPVAKLRNRANITYINGVTRAPAIFNWIDMQGTTTLVLGYTWIGLNQFTSPGLGTQFNNSGYSQASGTLQRCIAGWCQNFYYVSRLHVTTSSTYCQ